MASDADSSTKSMQWQRRLLPLMVRMLAGLTIFFFLASFAQLFYLHARIADVPRAEELARVMQKSLSENLTPDERAEARRLSVAAALESNLVARRYHQANIAMMSRVWVQYLGFVTGMTLALVGAAFVLGQVSAPMTELEAKAAGVPVTLRSASPGLTLGVLGVILMITTIVTYHEIQTTDISVYFDRKFTGAGAGVPPLKDLEPPTDGKGVP